jgi:hypothetical protein
MGGRRTAAPSDQLPQAGPSVFRGLPGWVPKLLIAPDRAYQSSLRVSSGRSRCAPSWEIVAGRKPGRTRDDQVTIADLTGVGFQDTAIASLAFERLAGR